MSDNSHDYRSAVNHVIAVCKDAEEGFRGAANAVKDPNLKAQFERYSAQRAAFAAELRTAAQQAGIEPANPSAVLGTLHHGWIALKGVLTGHSEHQILEETERGEDLSVKRYQEALSQEVPAGLRSVLERQFQEVQQAHSNIRQMRDIAGKSGSTRV